MQGARRAPNHITFGALYAARNECREEVTLAPPGSSDNGWEVFQGGMKAARFLPDGIAKHQRRVRCWCGRRVQDR